MNIPHAAALVENELAASLCVLKQFQPLAFSPQAHTILNAVFLTPSPFQSVLSHTHISFNNKILSVLLMHYKSGLMW